MKDISNMPEPVKAFVAAVLANARQVWTDDADASFIEKLVHVDQREDGSVTICDNFEKFFSTIYRVAKDGSWTIRTMYSDEPERPYSFAKAMADAGILYTG